MRTRVLALILGVFSFVAAGCSATIPVTSQADIDAINDSAHRHTAFVKTRDQAAREKTKEFSLDAHAAEWTDRDGARHEAALVDLSHVYFRDHWGGLGTGLGVGLLAGSALGAFFGAVVGDDAHLESHRAMVGFGAAVFGGAGAVLGGALGGARGDRRTYFFPANAIEKLKTDHEYETRDADHGTH